MRTRNRQRGQATVEYIIVTGALVAALLAEVYVSREDGSKINVIEKIEETYHLNYQGYSYAMSLSTPPRDTRETTIYQATAKAKSYLDRLERYTDLDSVDFTTSVKRPKPDLCSPEDFPEDCSND
ncbi:MAG TPA: hypothetical protein VKA64_10070 [Gammaproteobacteria bacterium]|nr:hypothetical protein [Gammaproteobacteria bacterium]